MRLDVDLVNLHSRRHVTQCLCFPPFFGRETDFPPMLLPTVGSTSHWVPNSLKCVPLNELNDLRSNADCERILFKVDCYSIHTVVGLTISELQHQKQCEGGYHSFLF